eukprot:EG_transcript_12316
MHCSALELPDISALIVSVSDPQLEGTGRGKYTSYRCCLCTTRGVVLQAVRHRFSEFRAFARAVRAANPQAALPEFPAKSWLSRLHPLVVRQRCEAIGAFIAAVHRNRLLAHRADYQELVGYSRLMAKWHAASDRERLRLLQGVGTDGGPAAEGDDHDDALHAKMFLRGTSLQLLRPLPHLSTSSAASSSAGCPKSYFLVQPPKPEPARLLCVLTAPAGPATLALADELVRRQFLQLLRKISGCPWLCPLLAADYLPASRRLFLLRPVAPEGSLRDHLFRASPLDDPGPRPRPGRARALPVAELRRWGRQVLLGLQWLQSRGLRCPRLALTTVLLLEGRARLSGVEAALLDPEACAPEAADQTPVEVLRFGAVLLEMATGLLASKAAVEGLIAHHRTAGADAEAPIKFGALPGKLPPAVEALLTEIFDRERVVTVEGLLAHPFFSEPKLVEQCRCEEP